MISTEYETVCVSLNTESQVFQFKMKVVQQQISLNI